MIEQAADHGLELAAIVAGLTALGWLLKRLVAGIRALRRWGRHWAERFEAVEGLVHHELQPNSGSSVKDALDRIERRLNIVDGRGLMLAGMLAQRNAEGRQYVDAVRTELARQGITMPLPPTVTDPDLTLEEDPHA